jgi:carbon storage regulator
MLALTRKVGESIMMGDNIEIKVVEIRGDKVRLGFVAPRETPIHRKEIYDAIQEENRKASYNQSSPSQPQSDPPYQAPS